MKLEGWEIQLTNLTINNKTYNFPVRPASCICYWRKLRETLMVIAIALQKNYDLPDERGDRSDFKIELELTYSSTYVETLEFHDFRSFVFWTVFICEMRPPKGTKFDDCFHHDGDTWKKIFSKSDVWLSKVCSTTRCVKHWKKHWNKKGPCDIKPCLKRGLPIFETGMLFYQGTQMNQFNWFGSEPIWFVGSKDCWKTRCLFQQKGKYGHAGDIIIRYPFEAKMGDLRFGLKLFATEDLTETHLVHNIERFLLTPVTSKHPFLELVYMKYFTPKTVPRLRRATLNYYCYDLFGRINDQIVTAELTSPGVMVMCKSFCTTIGNNLLKYPLMTKELMNEICFQVLEYTVMAACEKMLLMNKGCFLIFRHCGKCLDCLKMIEPLKALILDNSEPCMVL